jgi:transcriptional regulator NrdR family protein
MLKTVIKKGGSKQDFNPEKIKESLSLFLGTFIIDKNEKEKSLEKILKEVLKFLKGKKEVFTSEIEAKIILELTKIYPEKVEKWREYRANKEKFQK